MVAAAARASASASVTSTPARAASARTAADPVPFAEMGKPSISDTHAVHHDRSELHAGAVLDGVCGVDELVDRCLLGERHEHHLAARRVGEQLDHVGCLLRTGPTVTASRRPRGEQELHGMTRGRSIEDDEVRRPPSLELFHLAEDEDVLHPRRGG